MNWLRNFFRRQKMTADLSEEMQQHLEEKIEALIAGGMPRAEAVHAARRAFGNATLIEERSREVWMWPLLESIWADVRYALRGFRRNPLFTVTVIATLALGIGATTAVFSFVDRILFRPLPYANPSRIVSVGFMHSLVGEEFMTGRFYVQWQDEQQPFSAMAGQSAMVRNCDLVENNPEQLSCISFQRGMLPLMGVSPILGRNFLPEEDRPEGPRVVMISYALWQSHYSGDPHILERMIDIDGTPARVVGVLPKDFQFPTLQTADIVFPMAFDRAVQLTNNGGYGWPMRVFARLKPGVTIAQASEEMQPLFDSERKLFPAQARNEVRLVVRSLRDRETQAVRPVAWILLGFVLAVLMIACANVAGLMMARAAARQRELAVRSAIGASRGRLVRRALTEALLLSFAGAVAGLALAKGLLTIFVALAPSGIPFLSKARLDLRVAVFTGLLSCMCGVIFGLASALQKPGLDRLNVKTSTSRKHALLRRTLVTAQIGASVVLLSGAALLLHSFEKIEDQNLGMKTGGVVSAEVALPWFRYNTNEKTMEFYLRVESELRRLPGTRAVAISDSVPPGGWQNGLRFSDLAVQGRPRTAPGTGGDMVTRDVTRDYFRALDIPIIRGPGFRDRNGNGEEREAVLSRLLAAKMFPNEDPVGERIQVVSSDGPWFTVVGVADNVKNSGLTEPVEPEIYFLRREVSTDWDTSHSIMLVDSVMPPSAVAPWVRSQVRSIDPTVPVEIEPLNQTISSLADRPRFETVLLAFFAFIGLVLSIVGLYGLIAFMTTQRTQEIGVRMAVGATRLDILRLILWEGVRLIALGGVVGLAAALALSWTLKSLLFGTSPYDPASYIGVTLLLIMVALVGTLVPARRAASIDPMVALRAE